MPLGKEDAIADLAMVLECSGHEAAAADGVKAVRKGGEVVLIGTPWTKKTDLSAWQIVYDVFYRFVHLRSGWECEIPMQPTEFAAGNQMQNFTTAIDWLASGRVKVDGLYDIASPRDAQKVYEKIRDGKSEKLVTLYDWSLV